MSSGLGQALVVAATLAAGIPGVAAPLLRFDQQLIAPDSEPADLFGKTVDLDGEFAIVRSRGDYGESVRGPQTHVFRQGAEGSWSQSGVTVHALESDYFDAGRSAALDGGVIINGQVTETNGASPISALLDVTFTDAATAPLGVSTAAYSFERPWHPRDPDNPFRASGLERTVGRAVSISGDIAVANDASYSLGSSKWGRLHFYERNSAGIWEWSTLVTPANLPDLGPGEFLRFGEEVALDGHTALVTVRATRPRVYFYERTAPGEWEQSTLLEFEPPAPGSRGALLMPAIDGDTAVIRWGVYPAEAPGAVLILNRMADGTWEVTQEFDAFVYAEAGRRVAIEGDLMAFSAYESATTDVSQVLLYQRNTARLWDLKQTLRSPDPLYDSTFGSSVALDNGRLLIGAVGIRAPEDLVPGAAFLYLPVPEPAAAALLAGGLAGVLLARGRSAGPRLQRAGVARTS